MKKIIRKIKAKNFWFFFCLLLILVWGFFIRVWDLEKNPPGLHSSEATTGLNALEISQNDNFKIFYEKSNESLYTNAVALSFKLFEIDNFSIRIFSALAGFLTLIGFYLLLKELSFSRISSLLGLFFISNSFWHLNFSRTVYSEILVPFFLIWFFYLLLKSLRINNWPYFIAGGFVLGASFYSHLFFRIVPFLLIFILPFFFFYKTAVFEKYWKNLLIFLVTGIIVISPLFFYFYQNPAQFKLSGHFLSELKKSDKNISQISTQNASDQLNAFYLIGDSDQKNNHAGTPIIPPAWVFLFTIGFALSIKDIIYYLTHRKKINLTDPLFKISFLAQGIFWIMLIPGILTFSSLNSREMIGILPAVIIFTIIPFEYIMRLRENLQKSDNLKFKPRRWKILNYSLIGLVLIVVVAGFMEVYTYYFVWNKEVKTIEAFDRKFFDLGKLIKNTNLKSNNIIVASENILSNSAEARALDTLYFSGYPEIKNFQIKSSIEILTDPLKCQNNNFILLENNQWLIEQLQAICKNIIVTQEKTPTGYYEFWTLKN